jgi:hypothetical protein
MSRSVCHKSERSNGRRNSSVGLTFHDWCNLHDWLHSKLFPDLLLGMERASKFIGRSVCCKSELSNRHKKFIGRSVCHKLERSNGRRNSSAGLSVTSQSYRAGIKKSWADLSVTSRRDRTGVKIHRSVCLSLVRGIERASKFISRSVCLKSEGSNGRRYSSAGLSVANLT